MGLAHHSGGPLETFLEEPRAGLVEGVGAAGQPALLPTNTLPIYKRRWKAGQGQCLGRRAMRLGLRSPQSWQVHPKEVMDSKQMPHGMEHCSWWPGQGHAQAHSSYCLSNSVVWGEASSCRGGGRLSPDS